MKSKSKLHGSSGGSSLPILLTMAGVGVVMFGLIIWLLFSGLSSSNLSMLKSKRPNDKNKLEVIDFSGSKVYGDLRPISMTNMFLEDVFLYFEDEEAGSFIARIAVDEKAMVEASDGHRFYATLENSVERLTSIIIRHGVDDYFITSTNKNYPTARNEYVKYHLDAMRTTRPHPNVKLTNFPVSTAVAAKFV